MVDMNTTVDTLLDLAKAAVKNGVMDGEVFILRDLFHGIEWKRIPVEKRAQLGFRFYDELNKGIITGVEENDTGRDSGDYFCDFHDSFFLNIRK